MGTKALEVWKWFRRNILFISIPLSMIAAVIIGFVMRLTEYNDDTILLITFPGKILMRPFSLIFLPLVVSSIISGVVQMGQKSNGKIGMRAVIYYISTTVIAVSLGIILIKTIKPGDENLKKGEEKSSRSFQISLIDTFLDFLRNMFPENLLKACIEQEKTVYLNVTTIENDTMINKVERRLKSKLGPNIIGIMMFSLIVGIVVMKMDNEKVVSFTNMFNTLNRIIMKIVSLLLLLMPITILSLMIGKIMVIKDLHLVAKQLAMFVLTVNIGLLTHGFIILPLIYYIITRQNPFTFIRGILKAIMTAFGTSSSTVALPVTIKCLEENNGIDKRITRLIIPIGAAINMDGTALYEAVAAIFIAQINGIEFGFGKMIIISITATIVSIGASASAGGLVTMILVLDSVGLPHNDLFLIILVDWCLDRVRTSVNVIGDAFGAGIVNHLTKDELSLLNTQITDL